MAAKALCSCFQGTQCLLSRIISSSSLISNIIVSTWSKPLGEEASKDLVMEEQGTVACSMVS